MGNKIDGFKVEEFKMSEKYSSLSGSKASRSLLVTDTDVDEKGLGGGSLHSIGGRGSGTLEPLLEIASDAAVVSKELIDAVRAEDCGTIEELLKSGVDPRLATEEGLTPLQVAASEGLLGAVRVLLKNGVEANQRNCRGQSALWMAAGGNHFQVVEELASAGGDTDILCSGETAVHVASSAGHFESLRSLLRAGADPRVKNGRGLTPLHVATGPSVIELLLAWGGDVNSRSPTGDTPLHWASKHCYEDTLVLLQNDAEVNCLNGAGVSPLAMSVWTGNLRVAELLIQAGANVNLRRGDVHTPLHTAAQAGNLDMVQLLLDNGADPKIAARSLRACTWVYCTPSSVARYMGHQHVSQLLQEMEG